MRKVESDQRALCIKFGSEYTPTRRDDMIGLSNSFGVGDFNVNGLRHPIVYGYSGWYIWSGEYSTRDDFFAPIHAFHLQSICPAAVKYLALSPGWRFLFSAEHEDVWFDESLLQI